MADFHIAYVGVVRPSDCSRLKGRQREGRGERRSVKSLLLPVLSSMDGMDDGPFLPPLLRVIYHRQSAVRSQRERDRDATFITVERARAEIFRMGHGTDAGFFADRSQSNDPAYDPLCVL